MELLENYTLFSELDDWSVKTTLYGDDDFTEEKAPAELLLPGGGPDGPALEWDSLVGDLLAPEGQVVDNDSARADTLAPLALLPITLSGDQDFVVNELHALLGPSDPLNVESLLQPDGLPFDVVDYGMCDSVSEAGPLGSDDGCSSSSCISSPGGTSSSSVSYDSDCDVTPSAAAAAARAKTSKSSRSRAKPYDGLPKEKKDKKKLQNKNAATRYRQKKKAEDLILQADVHLQLERNRQLKERVASLEQEIAQCKEIVMLIFGGSAM